MATVIKMPKLSDTMEEGVVAAWHVKIGDTISSGDVIAEIETDKATMEFESFEDGTVLHLVAQEGKAAPVESPMLVIGEKGEDYKAALEAASKADAEPKKEEPKVEPKTEPKKQPAAQTNPPEKKVQKVASTASKASTPPVVEDENGRVKASPLARRLASEYGVNLQAARATGEGGRVVKRDVEKLHNQQKASGFVGVERYTDVDVSQMRKTIAKRLSESKFTAPHFYLTLDIAMDAAIEARQSINKAIQPRKISFNDMVIKAVAAALREHPSVNAGWHGDFIRYNEHVHVGVAVAVDDGLLVPVVRFADGKTLTQISGEVKELAEKARDKKLQPEEWSGNTFTISNLGMFGIEEFTAIINPPDSCILAIGGIRQEPVVKDGAIVPGNRMKVTMSCDHRVVDGATGAQFLQTFQKYMENPIVLLGMASI